MDYDGGKQSASVEVVVWESVSLAVEAETEGLFELSRHGGTFMR